MLDMYKKLFAYVPERRVWAYISMFLAACSVFVLMGSYYCLWKVFETILVLNAPGLAVKYGFYCVGLMILRGIFYIAGGLASHYLGFRLETNLRKTGLNKLFEASFTFFDKNPSGKVRKILDDNASETHTTVAHLIPDNVVAVLTPVFTFILTFYIDYRLGILLIITTAVGIVQYIGMFRNKDLMKGFTKAMEDMSTAAVEYIRGMQVIKIFGISVKYYKALIDSINIYKDNVYRYSLSCRIPYVSFQVLFLIYNTVAIPFGIVFISKGEPALFILAKILFFSVFSNVLFVSFMNVMFTGMNNFNATQTLNKLQAAMNDMDEAKLNHGEIKEMSDFNIEFKNVSFSYGEKNILSNFNLRLDEGRVYALVGPSGGGKSTIAKLISAFYPVTSGEIYLGNKPIGSYSEEAVIKNIAFVFQNSKLFKTSIYENVKIGKPNADKEAVMKALELAQCNEILDKFPDRENTIIGSKGVLLSGGETQRIAIARAILKDADIIILDEASAATDPENEYDLQKAFSNLMRGKTVIMIAHRLSSITKVDEILFVEEGKVVERGDHESLMKLDGRYKRFQELYERANDWRLA